MDYKSTLNLPKTDFAMKADLVAREPQRLAKWEAGQLYNRIQVQRSHAEKFVLHDGPPFANGDVHIGTALNKILKDIIVKYQTLRGKSAPYIPGWDCHGLPIEFKVTQEMRKAGDTAADPVTIRKACEAYARRYIDIQRAQFKRLGVLGDWENPYLTLDKQYEADELRLFADIVEKGFVYRGKKPVYWSIPCRTALAEAEVEYKDHVSPSIYVKFPVVGHPNTFVLIWTTTPWTLPANLAIAYNSTFSYSQVLANGESYILSTMLLSSVAEKCGWGGYQIMRSLDGDHLRQIEFHHPFIARTGRLFPGDSYVENTTGTGFVHTAPGHGLEDYGLGLANGLPIYSPVDDDGRFTHTNDLPAEQQMPPELLGKSILEKNGKSEANEAVLQMLRDKSMLAHQEDYLHSYPHCWRSKTPVIFRAMDQWFIRIDHVSSEAAEASPQSTSPETIDSDDSSRTSPKAATFRQKALGAIGQVHWVPDWGKSRIEAAVKSRPDWCISRQRTWGVPIPAFYDANSNAILDAEIVRNAADLIGKNGSNVWFEKSPAELWTLLRPKNWKGAEAVAKSNDTLDVWIDSGSSSRSVLMRRPEFQPSPIKPQPAPESWRADMYLEGSDQHRGWFQSSLLLSLAGNNAAPYKTVLTHGFMVDADREKISKSKQGQGAYEKPQTAEAYVKKYGADVVRLWVASQDFRNDIIVSEERINKVSETYRMLRNTLRYQLSNLYDFDPTRHTVPDGELTGLDRWVLNAFSKLEAEIIQGYDAYEFHVVYQKISQFVAVELSAIYHDVLKDRLYTDPANSHRRRSAQTALYRLVAGLCKMLSPILTFTSDEAWEFLQGRPKDSIHEATWEPAPFTLSETEQASWGSLFALREFVLTKLEEARQKKEIGKALDARLVIKGRGEGADFWKGDQEGLRELFNVSQFLSEATSIDPVDLQANQIDTRTNAVWKPYLKELIVEVSKADGQKCERCWHWETGVGSYAAHPALCGRCVQAVEAIQA